MVDAYPPGSSIPTRKSTSLHVPLGYVLETIKKGGMRRNIISKCEYHTILISFSLPIFSFISQIINY
jgi:hypothetical protein